MRGLGMIGCGASSQLVWRMLRGLSKEIGGCDLPLIRSPELIGYIRSESSSILRQRLKSRSYLHQLKQDHFKRFLLATFRRNAALSSLIRK